MNKTDVLQEVKIHPIDHTECEKKLNSENVPGKILENQVCSMNLNRKNDYYKNDACTGDSGGPYVCKVKFPEDVGEEEIVEESLLKKLKGKVTAAFYQLTTKAKKYIRKVKKNKGSA